MTEANTGHLAARLANRLHSLSFEALPSDVVRRAKLCILDQLGIQIRGSTSPTVQPALRHVVGLGASGGSTIVGNGTKTAALYAAYVNATFGNFAELDDAVFVGGHPGMHTVPVAIALAESAGLGGREVLAAVVAGYQIMALGLGPVYRSIHYSGWHGSQVSGVFGAAAAASKILELTPTQATHALAIAGSSLGGSKEYENSGGEVKRLQAGMAARSGIEAAQLASLGMTGPPTIFEGERGVWSLFAREGERPTPLPDDHFYILDTLVRFYPAVGTVHAPLDALQQLMDEENITSEGVEEIEIAQADWVIRKSSVITRPTDPFSAQFSAPFSIALRLVKGSNDVSLYANETLWNDRDILSIVDRVSFRVPTSEEKISDLGAIVSVKLKGGRSTARTVRAALGHPDNPATDDEIKAKFMELASPVLSTSRTYDVMNMIDRLETIENISEMMAALVE